MIESDSLYLSRFCLAFLLPNCHAGCQPVASILVKTPSTVMLRPAYRDRAIVMRVDYVALHRELSMLISDEERGGNAFATV